MGECAVQPASARRSAIKYNETGFAVLRADASMCNVQRKHAETNAVFSTQSLEQPELQSVESWLQSVEAKGVTFRGWVMRCTAGMRKA